MMQRCSSYLTLQAGTGLVPFQTSVGWPRYARFMQLHVGTGLELQAAFAKDLGTIGPSNPASWEAGPRITGPNSSILLALPDTGQVQLSNYAATSGSAVVVFLESLGD